MKKPLIDNHGEVRELTSEDMAGFKPIAEAAPDVLAHLKRSVGQRGAQKAPTKVPVSLRLDDEVVEHFRSSGRGWQGRINDLLVEHIGSLSRPKRVRDAGMVMRNEKSVAGDKMLTDTMKAAKSRSSGKMVYVKATSKTKSGGKNPTTGKKQLA